MFSLFRKEVSGFFSSISGYLVIMVFLVATGLFLWVLPDTETNIPDSGYAAMDGLFVLAPWIFLFLLPAVTMRTFAEENKTGTIELLLTRPLTDLQIVTAKYLASVILALISLLPTLIYFITIYRLASPAGNVDVAGISGSYVGLLFLCSGFAAIGVFSSAVSNSQIIAFILSLLLCFFFYTGFDLLASMGIPPSLGSVIAYFGISNHYASLSRGVIDSRDVIYFLSLTVFFLLLTRFVLEKRKW